MPVPSGLYRRTYAPDPVITYITSIQDITNLTTYTYTAASVGIADFDRLIVVGASSADAAANRTVASITINGLVANLHIAPAGDIHPVGVASLVVPFGTTADIGVTYSGACARSTISIWTITNYASSTPIDAQGIQSGGATSTLNRTFAGVDKCVGVFMASKGNTATCTWVNATERYDTAIETERASAADTKRVTTGNFIVTSNWSSASDGCGLCGALWF